MPKVFLTGLILAVVFVTSALPIFANEALSAEQIIRKAIVQSQLSEESLEATGYTFTKTTKREQFDENGRIQDRTHRLHEILFKSGSLLQKRVPSAGESSVEAKKIENEEAKVAAQRSRNKISTRGEFLKILTPELVGRYDFRLVRKVNLKGRPAFELAFQPKGEKLPNKGLADRVLNQATGTIWIDVEEFEVAKAQIHLDKEILVGGGLIGCLKRAAFILERDRLPGGIWFDRSTKADYEARRLLASIRVITKSESRNFRVLSSEG